MAITGGRGDMCANRLRDRTVVALHRSLGRPTPDTPLLRRNERTWQTGGKTVGWSASVSWSSHSRPFAFLTAGGAGAQQSSAHGFPARGDAVHDGHHVGPVQRSEPLQDMGLRHRDAKVSSMSTCSTTTPLTDKWTHGLRSPASG